MPAGLCCSPARGVSEGRPLRAPGWRFAARRSSMPLLRHARLSVNIPSVIRCNRFVSRGSDTRRWTTAVRQGEQPDRSDATETALAHPGGGGFRTRKRLDYCG